MVKDSCTVCAAHINLYHVQLAPPPPTKCASQGWTILFQRTAMWQVWQQLLHLPRCQSHL